jgi:hypothetical protein
MSRRRALVSPAPAWPPRYAGGDRRELEHLVQRVIFKTPAILFAVTSRSYLDWGGSATDELDHPGLHAGPRPHSDINHYEPRQHLAGPLPGGL